MDAVNHQFRLAARPVGLPVPSDWSYTEEPVKEPGEGEVLVKVRYISLDPAMRGWMNEGRSYIPPVGIGEVMRSFSAGEVIASRSTRWPTAKASSRWTRASRPCPYIWARWGCPA
jgi:NADPH-dependent curcumin reductase CurA